MHDDCTIRWYNGTYNYQQAAACSCRILRFGASRCCVSIIPPRGAGCKVEKRARSRWTPRYGAYLLRYWEVRSDRPGQPGTWRFSLEEAGTGERHGFRDLESLLAYLREELEGG
jgi:hypothetical protein